MADLGISEALANAQFSPFRRAQEALAERYSGISDDDEGGVADRDEIQLSLRAQAQAQALESADSRDDDDDDRDDDDDDDDFDSVDESANALLSGPVGGFLHGALNGIKQDLGKLLSGFGFGPDAAKDFAKSFIEPVLEALKEGVSFTAELSYAAFSQVTKQTDNSFSQSTALVAKSLSIEVNNETGDVSVSLASLSFRQEVRAVSLGEAPLLALGPGPILPPQEKPVPEALTSEQVLGEDSKANTVAQDEDPLQTLLADLQRKLSLEAVSFQAAIAIRSLEFFENEKGEPITRLEVDAEVPLDGSTLNLPEEQRDPLDLTV